MPLAQDTKEHTQYAYGLNKPLARYRLREDSISSNVRQPPTNGSCIEI